MLDKSRIGHVMVQYLPDWTNIGFSFILLTVNLFRHPTLIEHGLCTKSFCLFVRFVALCPKSTAIVMAGRSVHLTTHFPGQA